MIIPMAIEFNWIRREIKRPELRLSKEAFLPAIFVLTEDRKFVIAWFLNAQICSHAEAMGISMGAFKSGCSIVQSFYDKERDHTIKDISIGSGYLLARRENIYASAPVACIETWEKLGFQMIGMSEDEPIGNFPNVEATIPLVEEAVKGSPI